MPVKIQEQLSPADAAVILDRATARIREPLIARVEAIEYPIEAVVEMALASFLDSEALGLIVNQGADNSYFNDQGLFGAIPFGIASLTDIPHKLHRIPSF